MEQGFGGADACEVSGITYRRLDYWARTGLVRPSIRDARGSGSHRRYSTLDVLLLALVAELSANGLSLQCIRSLLPAIRPAAMRAEWLVVWSDGLAMPYSAEEIAALLQHQRTTLVVPLEPLRRRVALTAPAAA